MEKISSAAHIGRFATRRSAKPLELTCSVDGLAALRTAVESGADWVRLNWHIAGNKRHFFSVNERKLLDKSLRHARNKGCLVSLDISFGVEPASSWEQLRCTLALAADLGVDAVVLSAPASMLYASARYPDMEIHAVVHQEMSHAAAINFSHACFGVSRVILPAVISLPQLRDICVHARLVDVEINGCGHLNGLTRAGDAIAGSHAPVIDFDSLGAGNVDEKVASASAEDASNDDCYVPPVSCDASVLQALPWLAAMGVRAVQVSGHDQSLSALAQVVRKWREAIDGSFDDRVHYVTKAAREAKPDGPKGVWRSS